MDCFVYIFIEDQLVVKVIYQKDKYGECETLAELEGLNNQHVCTSSSSSPTRGQTSEVDQTYNRSPMQTLSPLHVSPLSMLSNQSSYSLWSTEENVATDNTVDSRLSPNAQEFRYPTTKQQTLSSPTNIVYQKDSSGYSYLTRSSWSSTTEPIVERRQSYTSSLQSFYSNWLDNSYKQNYNSSQLEIMA